MEFREKIKNFDPQLFSDDGEPLLCLPSEVIPECICTGKQEYRLYMWPDWNLGDPTKSKWQHIGDLCEKCIIDFWSESAYGSAVFKIKEGKEMEVDERFTYRVGVWLDNDIFIEHKEWLLPLN